MCCVNFPVPSLQSVTCNSNSVTGMQAQALLLDQERGVSQMVQKNLSVTHIPNQIIQRHCTNGDREAALKRKSVFS